MLHRFEAKSFETHILRTIKRYILSGEMSSSQDTVVAVAKLLPQLLHDEIGVADLPAVELHVGRLPLAPQDHGEHVLVSYLVHPQPSLQL